MDVTRGLNEDKLKSMKKGPRTRTLKSTRTWKRHQRLPTQELQNVSKNEKRKKVKMMTRFEASSRTAPEKEVKKAMRTQARRYPPNPYMVAELDNLKNAELRCSKDTEPKREAYKKKKYPRIQGYGRETFFQKSVCF